MSQLKKLNKWEDVDDFRNEVFWSFHKDDNFEIEFQNGWKIKEHPHVEIRFETNSKEDRDYLINKLMKISGQN